MNFLNCLSLPVIEVVEGDAHPSIDSLWLMAVRL